MAGHLPEAISLPHGRINERNLAEYPAETLFVVYCSGPHCNGADRAAVRLARLGRPVKKMIGGIQGGRTKVTSWCKRIGCRTCNVNRFENCTIVTISKSENREISRSLAVSAEGFRHSLVCR